MRLWDAAFPFSENVSCMSRIHRRGAENAEGAQRGGKGKNLLASLCVPSAFSAPLRRTEHYILSGAKER